MRPSATDRLHESIGEQMNNEMPIEQLWSDVAWLSRPGSRRYDLGAKLCELRRIYSERERNSGGQSAVVGHGQFEAECIRRGFRPRTVRDLIADYEIQFAAFLGRETPGRKTSTQKRRESRQRAGPKRPQHNRRFTDRHDFGSDADFAAFANLLSHLEARSAFRAAAKRLHPDHGGDAKSMAQLNFLWKKLEPLYMAKDTTPTPSTSDWAGSEKKMIQ